MALLSREFWHGRDILERPVVTLVALMVASGLAYLLAVVLVQRSFMPGKQWWIGMLVVGGTMRAIMFLSSPMLDDDHYRFLWDGGQVAQGKSPYGIAPGDAFAAPNTIGKGNRMSTAQIVAERVNHPALRSIYPPVAQTGFAAAHFIAPWNIRGLKIVWLMADLATFGLLVILIGSADIPLRYLLIYWWNPLLVKETYNSAHMDILVLPCIAGALVLVARNRHTFASFAIAVAAGVKLWPVLVFPVVLRHRRLGLWPSILAATVFVLTISVVTAPLLLDARDTSSGLYAYASEWEMNDSLYMLLHASGSWIFPAAPHTAARIVLAIILAAMTIWVCRVPSDNVQQVCGRMLYLVSALFLLGPTQFPWYWIWLLPLLTIVPVMALLMLTATLPLYYLRFAMDALGYSDLFDYGVVWIEFGPTLAILIWSAVRQIHGYISPRVRWGLAHER
ncbi:MAG: DUF2029 domain-containing protein [Candidatus Hydrogenedentes bacterium]|nr:DUF2029 domain-containing protein [Candidatus Hydrogenedentota bacterium]